MATDFFGSRKKKVIRSVRNIYDKATIVSIFPQEITEIKATVQPGEFVVPAGSYERPGILVIGPSSYMRNMDAEEMPMMEIPISAVQMAESIIIDYCNGLIGGDSANSMPGMFFLPGERSLVQILKENRDLLNIARDKQTKWYNELVRIADIDWARSNGNPISVSDQSRLAASELNKKDKPWMQDFKTVELKPCRFCGHLRNDLFPICPNCKQITDTAKAKELGLLVEVKVG